MLEHADRPRLLDRTRHAKHLLDGAKSTRIMRVSCHGERWPRGARSTKRGLIAATVCAGLMVVAGCGGSSTSPSTTSSPTISTAPKTATSTPAAQPLLLATLAARVRSGIVRIEVPTCDGEAIGTGFLVG